MIIININCWKKIPETENRVYLIDEIRGFCVIYIVVYHFMYDLVYFFNVNIPNFYSPTLNTISRCFAAAFILIAGISCNYSKNNLKRGIKCFGYAMIITIITYIIMPYNIYAFGVLHLLGISMIVFHFIKPYTQKLTPCVGLIIAFLLMHITYNVKNGFLRLLWFKLYLPSFMYKTNFLFFIGLPNERFYSSDYFPLLPWIFCFIAGSYFGVYVKEKKLPTIFYDNKPHSKLLATIGVNSLFIYIVHQPIIYLTLFAIFYFIN